MVMIDTSYIGFYGRFETVDKAQGSLLMGADNLVGDDFQVFFKTDDGRTTAWLKNKFDAEIGYFDVDASRKLLLARGRDQKIRALLSFVAYTDEPEPGMYWGEMAVFCYNPAYSDELDAFVDRCASKMIDGVRPNIDLGHSSLEKLFADGNWVPTETVSLPTKEKGTAIVKSSRSLSEKMIEQGRARNKGCYVISWLFIIIVIVAIAFGLHMAGLF